MVGSGKRIMLGLMLPILIATLCLTIYAGIVHDAPLLPGIYGFFKQFIIEGFLYALVYAVILGGLQSTIYSF